ncbi:hypothetical protein AMETH_3419 [Amycolatopsis methanolica 239]|uniref:Uncharacterized protein n=1 Tax=Amycolatopsis methanolica 239 TaxID=1068978 RepID=A0A076MWT8_AMYME|nr:hypothetical protein AMETH_3419 [Amycolatopsis methanolica 239]
MEVGREAQYDVFAEEFLDHARDGFCNAHLDRPQKWAGVRSEPARSEPMVSAPNPHARAAADPPEDPPAVRSWSHGLLVVP